MIKLGFVSAIVPDLSFRQTFEFAKEAGYSCVEAMCWPPGKAERRYAGVTHIDVTNLTDESITDIRKTVEETGISISGLGYYPNPLTPDLAEAKVYTDHLRAVISAAQKLEVGVVNTFVGRDWNKTVDENWPRFLETWTPLIQFAADHGVNIGIENCPMSFTRDEWPGGKNLASAPAIWRRMFNDIPLSNFGLNYDPSHFIFQNMDYLTPLREFRERLHHVHAKDVRLDHDRLNEVGMFAYPNEFHTPKLPGMGDVNWGKFFSILTEVYQGPICVEVEDRAYEGSLDSRLGALRQSEKFLRQFLA